MSEPQMYVDHATTLSLAWARAFQATVQSHVDELSPFLVSIDAGPDGQPVEDEDLRQALDACLETAGFQPIEVVAKTIFPRALWRRAKGDRHKLYTNYLESLPDYVAMEPQKNAYGLYFARLIGYGINPKDGEPDKRVAGPLKNDGNQLEFIIEACKPNAQRMALQAAIYDPVRDQTVARRHFPCLQHVTFVPDFARKTLSVNAFYALQLLYVKAYGNWLGLSRLGAFVADQTGLRFERLNCYAGIQKMTALPKDRDLRQRLTDLAQNCCGCKDDSQLVGTKN